MLYNFAWICISTFFHYHAGIYTCINTGMHIISHNHTKFFPTRVENFALKPNFYIFSVVAEICNCCASSEITTPANNTITYITQMPYMSTFHNNRILYLHCISNPDIFPDSSVRTNKAIWTYITIFPYYNRPFDIRTASYKSAFPDNNFAFYGCIQLHCALTTAFKIFQEGLICFQKIPWIPYIYPLAHQKTVTNSQSTID